MKVRMVKTGETATVNNSYGLRLIEQGKAVAIPEKKRTASAEKKGSESPAKEKADA
jgi:hypothetical protein|nr:MAG TPA: hypothetical protein [Caudoviricetes sp.]